MPKTSKNLRPFILHACYKIGLLRELSTVPKTPMGEDNWKLWTPLSVPFVSADFNLYPLIVINSNCEYNKSIKNIRPLALKNK